MRAKKLLTAASHVTSRHRYRLDNVGRHLQLAALVERGYDAIVYLVMATVATLLFLIRLGFSMVGGGDFDVDADFDSDASFTLFSVLSILAFFMGAGWMGLACRLDWGLDRLTSSLVSVGFGFVMMLGAAGLAHVARRLDRSVEYDVRTAVGRTGRMYLTVPAAGQGFDRSRCPFLAARRWSGRECRKTHGFQLRRHCAHCRPRPGAVLHELFGATVSAVSLQPASS